MSELSNRKIQDMQLAGFIGRFFDRRGAGRRAVPRVCETRGPNGVGRELCILSELRGMADDDARS
jgi:hypothetical protein